MHRPHRLGSILDGDTLFRGLGRVVRRRDTKSRECLCDPTNRYGSAEAMGGVAKDPRCGMAWGVPAAEGGGKGVTLPNPGGGAVKPDCTTGRQWGVRASRRGPSKQA